MRGKGWKEKEPRAEGEGPAGSLMPLRCKARGGSRPEELSLPPFYHLTFCPHSGKATTHLGGPPLSP